MIRDKEQAPKGTIDKTPTFIDQQSAHAFLPCQLTCIVTLGSILPAWLCIQRSSAGCMSTSRVVEGSGSSVLQRRPELRLGTWSAKASRCFLSDLNHRCDSVPVNPHLQLLQLWSLSAAWCGAMNSEEIHEQRPQLLPPEGREGRAEFA